MTLELDRHAIDAVVLDIEGTTTPMAFVYEVLFPFARRWLRPFLRDKRGTPLLREIVDGLREEWTREGSGRESPPPWHDDPATQSIAVAAYVEWLMDRDRKSPEIGRAHV